MDIIANMLGADGVLGIDAGSGANSPEIICAANENRFTAAHFSEPLTTYAVGWVDPENIEAILDTMFPRVQVSRRFEYKSATAAEAFLSESDDVRAIGSPFKKVAYAGSSVNQKTLNKGLTLTLDRDEMVDGDEEIAVQRLIVRGNRNDLRRGIALLLANDTNTGKTWDTTAGKDPDQDVLTELVTSQTARGIACDIVVYGGTAWSKRGLSLRAQVTAGGFASASLTREALAGLLGVGRVVKVDAVYQSAAATKTQIVNAYVFMYFAPLSQSREDASNVKHFWTPTESGRYRVYREEHAKTIDISVERYGNIVCPSALGIRSLTIS
jgi:hypothetical protein